MDHHWTGLKPDPKKHYGFVYLITHNPTGHKYVGRKNYWFAKQGVKGCKSRVQDKGDPKWKEACWKESDWKDYKGSSKSLKSFMRKHDAGEFSYEIIRQCRSRGVLTFSECEELWERKVLTKELPNGEYEYFNASIGAVKFRPKKEASEETKALLSEIRKDKPHDEEWVEKVAEANRKKDIYIFKNKDGREFKGTRHEFYTSYSEVDSRHVGSIISGARKTHMGWRIKEKL